jgi:hypothetical protein
VCEVFLNNGRINEVFLLFVPLTDFTGKGLVSILLASLDLIGINYNYMIEQGYVGAAVVTNTSDVQYITVRVQTTTTEEHGNKFYFSYLILCRPLISFCFRWRPHLF